MKVKGKKTLKNGAVAAYVYYSKEKKWKWRIIGRNKKQQGGNQYKDKYEKIIEKEEGNEIEKYLAALSGTGFLNSFYKNKKKKYTNKKNDIDVLKGIKKNLENKIKKKYTGKKLNLKRTTRKEYIEKTISKINNKIDEKTISKINKINDERIIIQILFGNYKINQIEEFIKFILNVNYYQDILTFFGDKKFLLDICNNTKKNTIQLKLTLLAYIIYFINKSYIYNKAKIFKELSERLNFYKINIFSNRNSTYNCLVNTSNIPISNKNKENIIKKTGTLNKRNLEIQIRKLKEYNIISKINKYIKSSNQTRKMSFSHYSNFCLDIFLIGMRNPVKNSFGRNLFTNKSRRNNKGQTIDSPLLKLIECLVKNKNRLSFITLRVSSDESTALNKYKKKNRNFNYLELPIRDFTAPTENNLDIFFNFMDKYPKAIIHCSAGYGRTGTMILAYIWYKKAFKDNDIVFNEYTFDQNLDIINFDLGFLLKKLFLNKIEKIIIYLQLELIKYNYESFQEIFNSYDKNLLKTRLKIINKVIIKRLKLSKNI